MWPKRVKVQGSKTFYFKHILTRGFIELNNSDLYDDFAWATKLEFNKYLEEEYYNSVIRSIDL